ncbi:MAG TPA: S8 family serine peptidase, partial [Chloroflexia bacterium]|nr:S8 family serine peptidase [Chloroflexia bacterium]
MATRDELTKVAIYYEGEKELELAKEACSSGLPDEIRQYGGVVEAWVTQEALRKLEAAGLIVEQLVLPKTRQADSGPDLASGGLEAGPMMMAAMSAGEARLPPEAAGQVADFVDKSRYVSIIETGDGEGLEIGDEHVQSLDARIHGDVWDRSKSRRRDVVMLDAASDGEGEALTSDGVAESADGGQEPSDIVYQVQLDGPITDELRSRLDEIGGEILGYRHPYIYTVYLGSKAKTNLEQHGAVQAVSRYAIEQSITPDLLAAVVKARQAEEMGDSPALAAASNNELAVPEMYNVMCHRERDCLDLEQMLARTKGVEIIGTHRDVVRIKVSLEPSKLQSLLSAVAQMPTVSKVMPFEQPTLASERCRRIIGINDLIKPNATHWTGKGEVVAVIDTGVDASHPDFKGRITTHHYAGSNDNDIHGHGTHVAGIIAGSGKASGGRIRGVAPEATLVAYRLIDDAKDGKWPTNFESILNDAFLAGARIINLSWQYGNYGVYHDYASQIDHFIYEHPEVLIVIAAGNKGSSNSQGKHKTNTVSGLATSKNAITVGASASDRKKGLAGRTWGFFRNKTFTKPAGDERIAGNPDVPSAESGRGPTDFYTIKPDLLAPGTQILSTWSSSPEALPGDGWIWENYPKYGGQYAFFTGTSMAAPVVSGAAAVLRQYLRETRNQHNPSAALLKAILLASTSKLPSSDPTNDYGYPAFDQGYGRLNLASILPSKFASPHRKLLFVDIPNGSPDALLRDASDDKHKAIVTYRFQVRDGAVEPLRIVLTWTDLPKDS